MAKRIYVIDTSTYFTDHRAINKFGIHDIVIPLKVLEEIDNHKKRQDTVGVNARGIIRTLDSLREKGNLHKGIRLRNCKCQKPRYNTFTERLGSKYTRSYYYSDRFNRKGCQSK